MKQDCCSIFSTINKMFSKFDLFRTSLPQKKLFGDISYCEGYDLNTNYNPQSVWGLYINRGFEQVALDNTNKSPV